MDLFHVLLFLHVLGAIVAFGPTFAFAMIGSMGGKEPMHANFAARVTEHIGQRLVLPLAVVQGITGVLLFLTIPGGIDLSKVFWLDVAVVLYLIALGYSYFVQLPAGAALVAMTSAPPPPPAAGAAPSGPPPALLAAVKKVQRGGMFTGILIVVIVFLMVVKPF